MAVCLLALSLGHAMEAQPTCAISIGADQTICQDSAATLQGPSGYGNYLWNTGSTAPSISVNSAGDYWCQVTYPSGNLVTNGDFSAGNSGFSSQFTYSLFSVQNEGYYTVGTNASWYHPQFQGTGSGNFLIANAGYGSWVNGQTDVWCQTIPCCPGQTYTLSFRARTLSNDLPGRAVWLMDGALVNWPDFTFPAFGAGWQQFTTSWTAGPGQTSVNACIHITSADGVGDDMGIDDINISGTIVLRDSVHVSVTPLPVVNLGPDLNLCAGDAVDLDASVPGGGYLWQDGSTGPTFHVTAGGTYSVTVTGQNCSNSDQISVGYLPKPVVQLGADTTLCDGSTLALSAGGPGLTTLWQDGSSLSSFLVNAPGLYWAEVGNGTCSVRDTVVVGYRSLPSVSLGNDTSICAGGSVPLDASWPGATYSWQDGSHSPTRVVSVPGTYHVTVDLNGCTAQDSIEVSVNPVPQVNLGPDTTVCPNSPVTFNALLNNASYIWNDGSTQPQLSTTSPGTYSVQVTLNGCSATDTVELSNFNLQTVNLGPDRTLCAGSSARIGVTIPGASYTWSTGAVSDSITVSSAGNYWVDASLNGCTVRDSILVSTVALPVVDLGPDKHVCPGNQTVLDATTPGATYQWNSGSSTPSISAGVGIWSVLVTVNGCSASDTVAVTALTPPFVDLGPDTTLCPGNTITLNAGPASNTYVWSTGSMGQSIVISAAATVSVTATDAAGCTASDAISVAYANPGLLSLGPDTTICAGTTALLDADLPGATNFHWNTGGISPAITVGNAGTYWVEVAVGFCVVHDTITVGTIPVPSMTLGGDTVLCQGETLLLQLPASPNLLEWQDGSSADSFLVTGPGDYWVSATNSMGCSDTATIHVGYLTPGAMDLGPDTSICAGTSLVLDPGLPGGSTLWSGTGTGTAQSFLATSPGTYIATTTVAGCSVTDSVTISVIPLPMVSLGPDVVFCSGGQVELHATGTSLLWDDGSTATHRIVGQPGLYWVRSTENGCSASDSVTVTEVPLPALDLGQDTAVCSGSLISLNATVAGGTYLWNDGYTAPQRTAGPGTWTVVATSSGCSSTDSIMIGNIPVPVLQLPSDTTLCNGASWLVDVAQTGCTYQWSTGATDPSLLISSPGIYAVSLDRAGCTTSGQVQVSATDLSTFTLGDDTTLCPGSVLPIWINLSGASVLWDNGSTNPHRTISSAGIFYATVHVDGCTADASLNVAYTALPAVDLGPDLGLCAGDTATLSVNPGLASVLWSSGSTAPVLSVTTNGTYAVTLSLDGCSTSDAIHIAFQDPINGIDLGPDAAICPGHPIILNASLPGAIYLWNNGTHLPTLEVNAPGIYSVTLEGPCIHATDTIVFVEGQCTPLVFIPNAFTPDGDQINDVFMPVVEGDIRTWDFLVFDRWGSCIFQSRSADEGWDGLYKGQEAPIGVYAWTLHYTAVTDNGVVQERQTGSVTLVR
jgi:gliding motility-associated-like protein